MTSQTATAAHRFVQNMAEQAADEPAIRAALRSGLGQPPDRCHQMHRYLATWLRRDPPLHQERVFYTVAALIGRAPTTAVPKEPPGDLGDSLALAAVRRELAPRTCSRYLHLLTRQPPESLCRHVTTAVMALQGKLVPIDFVQLLNDLRYWPEHQNQIAKRWQQHYFKTAPDEDYVGD